MDISGCLRINTSKMEKLKIEVLGWIEKETGRHLSNTCYSIKGLAPTVMASLGIKQPGIFIVVEDRDVRVQSSEFRVQSSEFRVQSSEFRVFWRFKKLSQELWAA